MRSPDPLEGRSQPSTPGKVRSLGFGVWYLGFGVSGLYQGRSVDRETALNPKLWVEGIPERRRKVQGLRLGVESIPGRRRCQKFRHPRQLQRASNGSLYRLLPCPLTGSGFRGLVRGLVLIDWFGV